MDNANDQLDRASKSYKTGGLAAARAALDEVLESVELAKQSLDQTGRNPRNSSDYKNLELKTRALLKKLGSLVESMSFQEREELKPMLDALQKIHDDTLMAIMEGQKKKGKQNEDMGRSDLSAGGVAVPGPARFPAGGRRSTCCVKRKTRTTVSRCM